MSKATGSSGDWWPWVFDRSEDSVSIRWDGVKDAKSYAVQMRECVTEKEEAQNEFKTLSRSIKSTSVRKKHLLGKRLYEFRVAAVFDDEDIDESAWSASLVAGPMTPGKDIQMEAPKCVDVDGSSAVIVWKPQIVDGPLAEAPYALQMATEEGRWIEVSSKISSDRVKKKHLQSGTSYYFRVKPTLETLHPAYDWSQASAPITIPQKVPSLATLFGDTLFNSKNEAINTLDILAGKLIAVYASASW